MKFNFHHTLSFIGVLFTLAGPINLSAAPTELYTLSDLEILSNDNSFEEFFAHAFDIRPTERTEVWKKMMERMGENYLQALDRKDLLDRHDFQQMENLMSHNVLKQNEFFRQGRQKVGLKWFRQCFNEQPAANSPCWHDLALFWAPDRQEIDLAPRLYSVVAPYLHASQAVDPTDAKQKPRTLINAVFILHPMLINPISGLQCTKPEMTKVVWTQALKEWEQSLSPQGFNKSLESWAHPQCWDSIATWSKQFFKTGASQNELDLAFQLLSYKNKLTPMERDLYLTNYLLSSPARGDLFNLAWNRIQELGLRPQEREQVLKRLKNWRPLPGKIFGDSDLVKRKAISLHLKRHFPEFIDFYAHTCIDFFGGKKRFPQGNPAHNCREMFELAGQEKDLLPISTVESFKQSLTL